MHISSARCGMQLKPGRHLPTALLPPPVFGSWRRAPKPDRYLSAASGLAQGMVTMRSDGLSVAGAQGAGAWKVCCFSTGPECRRAAGGRQIASYKCSQVISCAAEAAGATSKLFHSSQQCTGGRVFLFMSAGSRQAIASCGQVAHASMPL